MFGNPRSAFLIPGALAAASLLAAVSGERAPAPPAPAAPRRLAGAAAVQALQPVGSPTSLGAALQRARYRAEPVPQKPGTFVAANPAQRLTARFQPRHVEVLSHAAKQPVRKVAFRTVALGRGNHLQPITPGSLQGREDRVEYVHHTADGAPLTEWWVNTPAGLEQGWVVADAPSRMEERKEGGAAAPPLHSSALPLTLAVAIEGDLKPVVAADGQTIDLQDRTGAAVLHGSGLKAWDTTGRLLPIRILPNSLSLEIDDRAAVYPVTIDPSWTQQQQFAAADGAAGDNFGFSIAISGDTAVVGAPFDDLAAGADAGSAYVFVRSGGTWTQQQQLTAADGAAGDNFGYSVAVSGDTAVVGAPLDDYPGRTNGGSAYVFVRSGGTWTQQQQFSATGIGGTNFGWSVAIAGDTAVVGHPHDYSANGDAGSASVFVRSGATWTLQQKLSGIGQFGNPTMGSLFGWSVATTGDVVAVGAPRDAAGSTLQGVVFTFYRSGSTWFQAMMLTSDPGTDPLFGYSVAMAGNMLIAGRPTAVGLGSAVLFAGLNGFYGSQAILIPPDSTAGDKFGSFVAMDGNTMVVASAGLGAAHVYTSRGSYKQRLTVPDGASVAVDGDTMIVGAPKRDGAGSDSGSAQTFLLQNIAPDAQADKTLPVVEETITGMGIGAPTDVDGDSLTATVNTVPTPSKGVVRKSGGGTALGVGDTLTVAELTGLEFHPALNQNGAAGTFVYTVSDGNGGTDTQTVTISITPVNDPPTAHPQAVITTRNKSKAITLTGTDIDGDALTYNVASNPSHGTLSGTVPNLTYTPATGYFGPDSFAFTAYDGTLTSPTARVTVLVNAPPTALPDTYTYTAGTPLTVSAPSVLANDTDVEGEALEAVLVAQPAYGTVSLAADGSFTYTPQAGYPVNTSFLYLAVDPSGAISNSATVTLNVTGGISLTAPATVTTGLPLTAQWTAPAGQSTHDWVALYRTDATGPGGYLGWQYTGGTATGTYTLPAPEPGTYVFRYYLNDGGTAVASSNTVTVTAASGGGGDFTLTAPATVAAGSPLTVTWSAPSSRTATDWVAFYPQSTPGPAGYLAWQYTTGTASGTFTVTAPAAGGPFVFRYYRQDSSVLVATSSPVTLTGTNAAPTVALDNPTGPFTAPASLNLAAAASDSDGTVAKVEFYEGSTKLGEATSPNGMTGKYELAWSGVAAGTYSVTAKAIDNQGAGTTSSARTVTVGGTPAITVTLNPATVAPVGTYTLSWTAPSGRPGTDWIGVYSSSNPGPTGYVTWFYTSGARTGSRTFTAGAAGDYLARYYLNDTSTLGAASNTLSVVAPAASFTVTPNVTSIATGGMLTVSWTASAGRPAKDWVALVKSSQLNSGSPQTISGYVKWAYTGGSTTGSTTFNLTGAATGTYYVVYLLNDGTTVGALSSAVTITP